MKKPEWKKELEDGISAERTTASGELTDHTDTLNIHRKIFISAVSPTNADGAENDIWITYSI